MAEKELLKYLKAIKSNRRTPDLHPINSGEEQCPPLSSWGAGVRRNFLMHYVIAGKGTYVSNGVTYEIKEKQAFFIFPDEVVYYAADEKEPWHYVWVEFRGEDCLAYLEKAGIKRGSPVLTVSSESELLDAVRRMPKYMGLGDAENLRSTALLFNLFSALLTEKRKGSENAYFLQATEYIRQNLSSAATVEEVAAAVGLSRKYLFAVFKRSCGQSPKEYILDYKIKNACDLLANPSLSIQNVAYSVGYSDALLFSKQFKKKIGASPSEYRKKLFS